MEWSDWNSGDCLFAPHGPGRPLDQAEVIRRIADGFRRVAIDWAEGDRWVEARIVKAVEIGYRGGLLEAEYALRGHTTLVSVAEDGGPGVVWVRFFMTPDTEALELHYEPQSAATVCRELARKVAGVLGYEFSPWEDGVPAEPTAPPDQVGS